MFSRLGCYGARSRFGCTRRWLGSLWLATPAHSAGALAFCYTGMGIPSSVTRSLGNGSDGLNAKRCSKNCQSRERHKIEKPERSHRRVLISRDREDLKRVKKRA
jgi:hypothetical protein